MKKTIVTIATMIAGIALTAASAAPLPEAGPDDAGFSQRGLSRIDDFFAREIAAKRVPAAVGAGRGPDADGPGTSAASGQACRLFSRLRRHEGRRPAGGRFAKARTTGVTDLHSRPVSAHIRPDLRRTFG